MKRGSLLQFLGYLGFISHLDLRGSHPYGEERHIKELTKTSKKLRPSQSQATAEENTPPWTQDVQDPPSESRRSLPVEK